MATRVAEQEAPGWREAIARGFARSWAVAGAIALAAFAFLLGLALVSYHPSDAALNTAAGGPAQNWVGSAGAWASDVLLSFFGPAVGLLLPLLLIMALRLWHDRFVGRWKRNMPLALIGVMLVGTALALIRDTAIAGLPGGLGGAAGYLGARLASVGLDAIADPVIRWWVQSAIIFVVALGGLILWAVALELDEIERDWLFRRRETDPADRRPVKATRAPKPVVEKRPRVEADDRPPPVISVPGGKSAPPPKKSAAGPVQTSFDLRDRYTLPPLDLLKPAPPSTGGPLDKAALERNARLLESVLDDFHVKGSIVEVRPGPVVTMYELEPAAGIKASRVIQLADDIARNMSALSARVATIPGRSVIGIELPNQVRESVVLHELVGSDSFEEQGGALPIILGKNIAGDPVIADLAPMPHLLVAGTTGSGKSVGLNAMILSLLYRLTPDQCRMIMIDPKMLELSIYDDIPHLLSPVVTDPPKAIRALRWAVEQMEERYRMMASVSVRSLASFNDKVRVAKAKGQPLGRRVQTGYDAETGQPIYEEEQLSFEPLPQIVVVVDELADLMMTAGKEVEFLIQRLAQKARAAGIHLIMATQRPSVDVITGVIKANLPTRISFQVTSKIDSRTILGEQGAEQLLGKGDMLYMPGGKQIVRVHGPFVSDDEVRAVADHWRAQGKPDYIQAVTEEPEDGQFEFDGAPKGDDSPEDQLYRRAVQIVAESQKASTSYVQRQLRVGYNSAARLIERMEQEGKVSRPDHVGRREVLIDTTGEPI
ncbi:DNA translocase FtsK [Sphingomonas sp. MAH-20]|uniref:DNA translocase FtsK n=1 Tax=Sphingomonas horti TaxID=2682842 RepID=A0A6I4IYA0_9SPHN|nr:MULTISPECIES: DNA translocase FtsK 4TM domain-containing protein [Sphingomonas]MBA2920887.1 DNA translocase FtsK 4TM domain-containing protein [Sphingomonas sp. CGMCC 1.13658]MVO76873.1 DNA translocase FtsK [Sphingomonas horti]